MKRRKQNLLIILIILVVPLTLMSGLLTNAVELPPELKPFAWPLLALVTLALMSIGVLQFVLGRDSEHPPPTLSIQNRRDMLERVRSKWINGFLEQSLSHTTLITLGLLQQPEFVDNPWRLEMQDLDWSARSLPSGTSISQVYDDANAELLILGDPGVGKTTLLLELTRELLKRSEDNENNRMPIVFNLASWALKRQPLTDWFAEELHSKYQVPPSLAQSWIAADQILPLLDGLDEVSLALRAQSVRAINVFRQEHGLTPTVVCSRSADYLALEQRVLLRNAVVVQPLTVQQIDDYLSTAGEKLAAVHEALKRDPVLQELASTPLMLNVLTLAYQDMTVQDILAKGSQRQQVFAAYVQRMLLRRGTHRFTSEQTMHYLTWLASMLVLYGQTEFYFSLVHPGWLSDYKSKQLYHGIVQLLTIGGLSKQTIWIRKVALHYVLWRAGYLPWNYASFLDYAVERILLRKVGESYIFVHQLLLEYFASQHAKPAFSESTAQATLTDLPTVQAPDHLDVYDIRNISVEEQLSVATMAGLINRSQPQVYLINSDDDTFWLNEVLTFIPHDTPFITNNAILNSLLTTYREYVQGMIIYDPNFTDSINIATTLAGQRDAIVVSPAQTQSLQLEPHELPVLADLRTYHWYNRLQAYRWAQQNLLGKASTCTIAGLDPMIPAGLRSFLVANRTFVYWLDASRHLPDPKCNWMSQRSLMRRILKPFPPGTMHYGWFIDEFQGTKLTSEAAIATLATDFFHNLEVWATVPSVTLSTKQILNVSQRRLATLAPKVYVSFTMSEGDSLQYLQHRMLRLWNDPARGLVPIGWTFSAVVSQLAPHMAAYYKQTATPNDELIAGPSGAGYMYPSRWPVEYLPAFLQRTGQMMQSMELTTLEILDDEGGITVGGMRFVDVDLQQWFAQALFPFGVRGVLSGVSLRKPIWTVSAASANTPIYHSLGLADSVRKTVTLIKDASLLRKERPLFLNIYILAWTMTPSNLKQVVEHLGSEYEIVTPGTLLAMVAEPN